MANALYDASRAGFLRGDFNWEDNAGETYRVALVDTASYTPNLTTDDFFDHVSAAVIGTPVAVTNRTIQANGAADADDVTFTAVSGASIEAIVIYKWSGDNATSPLIAYIDTATGLPITPNGGDIIVTWDNGTNRIFRL